jgi:hypothetical protein
VVFFVIDLGSIVFGFVEFRQATLIGFWENPDVACCYGTENCLKIEKRLN